MLSSWIVGKALTDYRVKKLVLPHVVVDILRIIPPVVVVAFIHTAPAILAASGTDSVSYTHLTLPTTPYV